jgi:hypothetical protein
MRTFLRENPTIAFGLGLPLLLVVVIGLVSGIPSLFVPAPAYDVVYATNYYAGANGLRIQVGANRKASVTFVGENYYPNLPHIWRYNPKTNAVREIAIALPPELPPQNKPAPADKALRVTRITVPDLESLTLDPSSVAPDGYEFRSGENNHSPALLGDIFFSSRYGREAVLVKNGNSIRLPETDNSYGYNIQFIGWVVPK